MAKHSTTQTIKFKRLVRDIGECEAHTLGHLEMMWNHCHANSSPVFDALEDAELAAGWEGEPGVFADALVRSRWLDLRKDGKYQCHDYLEHAPYFVVERMRKRDMRRRDKECPGQVPDMSRTSPGMSSPPTNTNTNTNTSKRSNHKATGGECEGGSSAPEAVGDVALRCIADLANTGDRKPKPGNDELGHYRALITQATGGEFRWRGSHLIRVEAILQHPRGPTLIRERVIDPLENSESAEIKSPAAFANHALQALAKELGVGG